MNNLKQYRLRAGLTQKEVAKATGYSQVAVSRHERNVRPVPRWGRQIYARLYNTTMDTLFPDHPVMDAIVPSPVKLKKTA